MAAAHDYFNADKKSEKTSDGSTIHTWAAAAADVSIQYEESSSLSQPRNSVLTFPSNATLRIVMFPASEALGWIRFLQQVALNPAVVPAASGFASNTKLNVTSETVQNSEAMMRAKDAWVYNTNDGSNGYGYAAVTRCEETGVLRLIVKANMFATME